MTEDDLMSHETMEEVFDIDDLIERTGMIVTLMRRAEQLKAKTRFNKLLKAYEKDRKEYDKKKSNPSTIVDNVTHFGEEKYEQMRCGGWIADNNGVRTYTPFGGEVIACYHPIIPVQLLINAETQKEKIKLAYKKRNVWKEIIVDKGVIASANKIVALAEYGISVTSENARHLVKFLNDVENYNSDLITEQVSTSKLGWIKDEFMPFGTDIVFDNESKFKDAFESIREEGDADNWYRLAKSIRRTNRFEPKIYLAAAFASVLIEPLNALPFIVNLWGDTGKGKTVALMFATSVWACPSENGYQANPADTPVALELKLDFLNNLPMVLDDMSKIKDKYNDNFSEIVYALCSGRGKGRSNKDLGLNRTTRWSNCILTNNEHSLVTETMQGGAVNRIIDVEMEEGYIFENGNEIVEIINRNYGFAGRDFVDAIKQIGFVRVKEIQQEYYSMIKDKASSLGIEKEEKQILPMSILLTADKIATEYLFEDGIYMDFDTCFNLLKNKNEVSENDRAYDFINSEVAVNINKFVWDSDYKGEIWGVKDGGWIYIISSQFDKICQRGNFSRRSFLSWAERRGLIQTEKGRSTKNKRIKGSLCKCICVRSMAEEEEEFVEIDQETLPFD